MTSERSSVVGRRSSAKQRQRQKQEPRQGPSAPLRFAQDDSSGVMRRETVRAGLVVSCLAALKSNQSGAIADGQVSLGVLILVVRLSLSFG
jgi:hypothetical protein